MAEDKNKTEDKSTENSVDIKASSQSVNQENGVENNLELILGEKSYEYYLNNKKKVTFYSIAVLAIILGALAYKLIYIQMVVEPKEEEAIEKLWQAESKAFDEQDWESAINGDSLGFFKGFKQISKKYSGQNAGKIAQYNLGISLLNNKNYENAIVELKKVSFQDELLGTISQGAIGDAYLQLGAVSDAFVYYEKAYQRKENDLTTPLYLMRAAMCLEIEENYSKAIELYEMVYKNYPSSKDAVRAEKYAESLKLGNPVYMFDRSNGE
jgi:TolA-binding protein|tara:strand:+ start:113 stop:916 length:804 start_codon:yes stop_codon:yes gene_type:complete